MAGTPAGAKAAAETNLAKDPDFYRKIGSIGGKNGRGHQFAHGRLNASETGRLGGRPPRNKYIKKEKQA